MTFKKNNIMNEQYRFDVDCTKKKIILTCLILIQFLCIFIIVLFVLELQNNSMLSEIPFQILFVFLLSLIIFNIYSLICVANEKFISVIFINDERRVILMAKDNNEISVPYKEIRCVEVRKYRYFKYNEVTNICIVTDKDKYKITFPEKIDLEDLKENTPLKFENKNFKY